MDLLCWFFKKIKLISVINKKISKLKIDCDDILITLGKIDDQSYFNLKLNFFSQINERIIKIDGDKFSILCDLLKNELSYLNKKRKKIKLNSFNIKQTYIDQYKDFFNLKKTVCKLNEAIAVQKLINQISKNNENTMYNLC